MARKPRKVEELAVREDQILDMACRLMMRRGYQGFTMADVAEAIGYAKGTLYLHFESKEDMAVAIANRNLTRRVALLQAASSREAPSRERLMGLVLADERFCEESPEHFGWDHLLRLPSFWDRVSKARQKEHRRLAQSCLEVVDAVVEQAMATGDLPSRHGPVRPLSLMLVAFELGQRLTLASADLLPPKAASLAAQAQLERGYEFLLDGLNWLPLSVDFGWKKRRSGAARALKTLFGPARVSSID